METRLIQLGVLPPRPTVWDVGAFKGTWSEEIRTNYPDADLTLFKPVPGYYQALVNKGFTVHPYGLGDSNHTADITIAGDRSSTYEMGHQGTGKATIIIRDISEALNTKQIAVMKINTEGAEYPILERLLATDKLNQINTFLIQFHTFITRFGERYLDIKKGMSRTHSLTWRTPFVWERWDKRGE